MARKLHLWAAAFVLACGDDGGSTTSLSGGLDGGATDPSSSTGDASSDESSSSTGSTEVPGEPAAFRVTSLELVDPHFFAALVSGQPDPPCIDATGFLNDSVLGPGIAIGDLHLVALLSNGNIDAPQTNVSIFNATCDPPDVPNTCSAPVDPADVLEVTADNVAEGTCFEADPAVLGAGYDLPSTSASPCFVNVPSDSTLALSVGGEPVTISLRDSQIAASRMGDDLMGGVLTGFVTQADAEQTVLDSSGSVIEGGATLWQLVAGGAACELTVDDTDTHPDHGLGVWLFFNFEATTIGWTG